MTYCFEYCLLQHRIKIMSGNRRPIDMKCAEKAAAIWLAITPSSTLYLSGEDNGLLSPGPMLIKSEHGALASLIMAYRA
jgi:hypothetical protein